MIIKYHQEKEYLKKLLETEPSLAIVGRVKNWLYDPDQRYPISCTMISVEDSMEGKNGIEYSWLFLSKALRFGAGCAVDLSKLRSKDQDNGKGLIASGPVSFMLIYSTLNQILRRGGKFKNGAVVCYLDANHPDLKEFLDISPDSIPWAKKALYISDDPTSPEYILNNPLLDDILYAVRSGTLWLAKKRWEDPITYKTVNRPPDPTDVWKYRLFSQVCLEILFDSNSTCTLSHINLGVSTLDTLVHDFTKGAEFLSVLHTCTGAGEDNYYLSPNQDKQVGLGVIGLGNFLAKLGIKYHEFANALYDYYLVNDYELGKYREIVRQTVYIFKDAFEAAATIFRNAGMKRAFTIAPSANCSFNHVDSDGYTTSAEISPPICHPITKKQVRDSSTFGQKEFTYPPNIETAAQVGWDTYYMLVCAWQAQMEATGLAHSISFNIWNQCTCDIDWLKSFLDSPLVTTYYRMLVDQDFVDKSTIDTDLDGTLIEDTDGFFVPDDNEAESYDLSMFSRAARTRLDVEDDSTVQFCNLDSETYCMQCDS